MHNRIEQVIAQMKEQRLDQIIVTQQDSLQYLIGYSEPPLERLMGLLIDVNGKTALFVNIVFSIRENDNMQFYWHTDADDPTEELAKHLRGRVGIDVSMPARFLLPLMDKRKDLHFVLGSVPVENVRMLKEAEEIDKLRASSLIADEVMREAFAEVVKNRTEKQLEAFIDESFKLRGCKTIGMQIAAFGAGAAEAHHTSLERLPQPGEVILFDIFAEKDGYWSDTTRCAFYKEVSPHAKHVYETVKAAQLAAEAAIRPGVRMCEVEAAAKRVISEAGYEITTGRIGHGIGMLYHEKPDCSCVNEMILKPGMVFTIEPGIYLQDDIGVRIEDVVVVTENGVEVLNKNEKELKIIG